MALALFVACIMQDVAHDGLSNVGKCASVFCVPSRCEEVNQKLTKSSGIEVLAYLEAHCLHFSVNFGVIIYLFWLWRHCKVQLVCHY